jgi:hypothetical protein
MAAIVNHRIAGTRVTIWDVLHHLDNNWPVQAIADVFSLSPKEIQAAVDYIREHEDEVMEVHRRLEERNARGNPPEIEAKLAQARAKRLAWLREIQEQSSQEARRVGNRA